MRRVVDKSMLGRAWVVATSNDGTIGADNLVKNILVARGIVDAASQARFLNPCIKDYMPDPSVLRDMDVAARVIADSILRGDKIAIYGDYDVDGITSTAICIKSLRALGVDCMWHLPTRDGEGYGLNPHAIDEIAAAGVKLMITVDCGISGAADVAHASEIGMQVVVTDHHSPDATLPAAAAVVNPKRVDDTSGLSYLAGVGVAFMTMVAVRRELKNRNLSSDMRARVDKLDLMEFMDLVALGTICDTMPLMGLNRAFVATGLKILEQKKSGAAHVDGGGRYQTCVGVCGGVRVGAASECSRASGFGHTSVGIVVD